MHVVQPLAAVAYPEYAGLDNHKCFSIQYSPDKDVSLSTHFDNAEVTLNVSLGNNPPECLYVLVSST